MAMGQRRMKAAAIWPHSAPATAPRSRCGCGHTGDGPDSDHWAGVVSHVEGHGPCSACGCLRFRWAGWLKARR